MSDLSNCGCGCDNNVNGCGCGRGDCGCGCGFGNNSCLWIILLLICCGGCGNGFGHGGDCGCGAAVMTTVSGLFFCLSAVVDAAMALAAAKLPSILSVYTSDLMRGYLLLSPHIHSKTLSSGSVLWKNDRSFR